jgi:hypothetical protein
MQGVGEPDSKNLKDTQSAERDGRQLSIHMAVVQG